MIINKSRIPVFPGTRLFIYCFIVLEAFIQNVLIQAVFACGFTDCEVCDAAEEQTPYDGIDTEYCNAELIAYHIYKYAGNSRCYCSLFCALCIKDSADDRPEEACFQTSHGKEVDPEDNVWRC